MQASPRKTLSTVREVRSQAVARGVLWGRPIRPFMIMASLAALIGSVALPIAGGHVSLQPGEASAAPAGALKEFTLEAKEVEWELLPGTMVKAWTYGGSVPGPEIRVTEGDQVRVTLKNSLPVPTTIHWHGVDVPNAMDGVPGLTQDAVQPGESFTYEFTATNPGTRWYHSHQDGEVQLPLGMYGPLIIEPASPPPGAVSYNREYTYTLSEWSRALTPAVAMGHASLPTSGPGALHSKELDFDFFLMNGKAGTSIPPIEVKQGERVRIRLINAGQLVHTIHSHGHSFKVIALDGNFLPPAQQYLKDSVTLGPSERVDIELHAENPGVWMFHCHMQHHAGNGMMTSINYEGVQPPVAGGHAGHQHSVPAAEPVAAPAPHPAGVTAPAADLAAADVVVDMLDNRFQAAKVTVPVGATVSWANKGGNSHTVSAYDHSFESGAIQPGEAFAYTFTTPGEYRYLCRQHLLNGMTGMVTVQ